MSHTVPPAPGPAALAGRPGPSRAPSDAWILVVVGWLFASLRPGLPAAGAPVGPGPGSPGSGAPQADGPAAPPLEVDLARSPPRELRRLPGIGALRAAAIAEERWNRAGEPFPLRAVHGIGARTEERALEALGDGTAAGWSASNGAGSDGPDPGEAVSDGAASDGTASETAPEGGGLTDPHARRGVRSRRDAGSPGRTPR